MELKNLVNQIIKIESNYTKEEIIEQIIKTTEVSKERAERGFNLILEAGLIKQIEKNCYYLTGSTPF